MSPLASFVQCWGCGRPDAIHLDQADRDACRDGVARDIAREAAVHRRSVVGCACDACVLLAAAHKEAERKWRKVPA